MSLGSFLPNVVLGVCEKCVCKVVEVMYQKEKRLFDLVPLFGVEEISVTVPGSIREVDVVHFF